MENWRGVIGKTTMQKTTFGGFFVLIMLIIMAQFPVLHQLLVWDRQQIQAGQWWRIVTGNITHTNVTHLAMNVVGLLVITWLHYRYYAKYSIALFIWVLMVLIGLALFFTPFDWYAGLSGVLHGLFVWGVVKDIQHKVPLGWLMLCGILIKLLLDTVNQGDVMTATLIEANVAYQVHWIGAMVGLVFGLSSNKT